MITITITDTSILVPKRPDLHLLIGCNSASTADGSHR
jgi:hypothetical protein